MSTNSLTVFDQSDRFTRQSTALPTRLNPLSPMTLQTFMQMLADLKQKVDFLATRQPMQVQVKPVESHEVGAESSIKASDEKVD